MATATMAASTAPTSADTTYPGVLHRKIKGCIFLSDRGLFFRPENDDGSGDNIHRVALPWHRVTKHQVSPASHPKSLLKVVAVAAAAGPNGNGNGNLPQQKTDSAPSSSSHTFAFPDRNGLEGARRDVSARLSRANGNRANNAKKRPREAAESSRRAASVGRSTPPSSRYVSHDPVALVSTRSALLASDPALRAQHRLLVLDGGTLSEEDFWETHSRLVANEYAKISGRTNRGMSSDIRSSLDLGISTNNAKKAPAKKGAGGGARGGVVRLGVEEMRQIFIMYPAVHAAYEEKVPLELSEEQFWRKYLESEYFHRDRGRIGAHIGKVNERELVEQERILGKKGEDDKGGEKDAKTKKEEEKEEKRKVGENEAKSRLAAAGTDDIFSRYDSKHRQGSHHRHHRGHHHHLPGGGTTRQNRHRHHQHRKLGTQIAVGQFDLASTNEVERGDRYLQIKDLHPPPEKGSAGSNIINKYNRHWAIVLHPAESTAGLDLEGVAAASAKRGALSNDGEDAKVNGGCDRETRRLIGFADADELDADFARGAGDDDDLMELHLRNVDAYSGKFGSSSLGGGGRDGGGESQSELHLTYARYLAAGMRADTASLLLERTAGKAKGFCDAPVLRKPLPDPRIGRGLLEALTKKMAADSRTEADVQRLADELPEEFRAKLATFFRRSSELLRHFFSLRSVFNENGDGNGGVGQSESQKNRLTNIVNGMQKVHGEMYELTRNLPLMESKMFKPIMDQLDWAFKLHREDSSKSSGGFVTVAKGGFVPVAH